jgi:hypothetical protein
MPRARANAKTATVDELCREHFPLGWDTPHLPDTTTGVSCEHGQWYRDLGDRAGRSVDIPKPEGEDGDGDDPGDGDGDE